LLKAHKELYGKDWDSKSTHGEFQEALIAHSTDPDIRERSTSGGLVTAIILHLMEKGEIDGAVVIASDENVLWKGKPMIARTREEVLAAMKSKYAISPTNSVFSEILNTPGKYALVGLPCQIHGFRKAASLDSRLAERVVLTIGLFCHAAVEHDAFRIIWDSLGKRAEKAKRFVSRIGKHPGTPYIENKDGSSYPVYFGDKKGFRPSSMEIINIIYRLYTPSRCLTCFDATAEFADIAIGDPWMAPPSDEVDFGKGWSFALIRNEKAAEICRDLKEDGDIEIENVTRKEALACNEMMSSEKRWRSYRVLETKRRQGIAIPKYGDSDFALPKQSGKQFIKTELHMLTHIFCYIPRFRASILRFMLSDGGYGLLWLNNKRRTLRTWIRDTKARMKRKVFKRS
jgi:coenzyme F420 hydrogenase subunit beta